MLKLYTLFHVIISLLGIASGFVVTFAMLAANPLPQMTAFFLVTTVATSVTGFFFPVKKIMPSHVVGALSLVLLAAAIYGYYPAHLAGHWRWIYVVGAVAAQYFNVFVLIVQSFQKLPGLKAAPTGNGFKATQGLTLLAFIALGVCAVLRFHV